MDVSMPIMGGTEATRLIRETEESTSPNLVGPPVLAAVQ
jgi:CheY-like chemotaxis protein